MAMRCRGLARGLLAALPFVPAPAGAASVHTSSARTVEWFQKTEQALMDAVAIGDRSVWDRALDTACILTSEEGEVTTRPQFLDALRPLPKGLAGGIAVKELTVQEFPSFAVVRYLADEWESVFDQKLVTRYRVTDAFRRDGDGWKMVASHVAVVTQDPPAQPVSKERWAAFAGTYQLLPDGWTFTVALREGTLYGGRDPNALRPFIPLAPDAFVLSGRLGEWIFVTGEGGVSHILNFRKFEPLVWTRVRGPSSPN
jgi:Domain of unknown function (DUF4440)